MASKHRRTQNYVHAPSGIHTHSTYVRAAENSTLLALHGHSDHHVDGVVQYMAIRYG
jgi:hypothetical protein